MGLFSEKDREKAKKVITQCGGFKNQKDQADDGGTSDDNCFLGLNPAQLLVIAGIIGGGLQVDSVLVDRNQAIQIVLSGSLKRKTQLDMIMEQIGKMPFDQVMAAIMNNVT
jgi:hypothetical protein